MDAVPLSGAHSHSKPPAGEGERAEGEEKNPGKKGAEAVGDSEEDGEDVFEVERILDMKTEGVRERAVRGSAGSAWAAANGESREIVKVGSPAASRRRRVRVGDWFTQCWVLTYLVRAMLLERGGS